MKSLIVGRRRTALYKMILESDACEEEKRWIANGKKESQLLLYMPSIQQELQLRSRNITNQSS